MKTEVYNIQTKKQVTWRKKKQKITQNPAQEETNLIDAKWKIK